jgi:hypothetical protein
MKKMGSDRPGLPESEEREFFAKNDFLEIFIALEIDM